MLKKLENFLKKKKAKFKVINHRKVYTAWDSAATQHINIKIVAKTLLVKADNDYYFVVLSANKKMDINKLKKVINVEQKKLKLKAVKKISICSETVVKKKIVGKEGAMSAFGSFYGYKTFTDSLLMKQKKINLNAGSFVESLEMTPAQYKKIEEPITGSFGK